MNVIFFDDVQRTMNFLFFLLFLFFCFLPQQILVWQESQHLALHTELNTRIVYTLSQDIKMHSFDLTFDHRTHNLLLIQISHQYTVYIIALSCTVIHAPFHLVFHIWLHEKRSPISTLTIMHSFGLSLHKTHCIRLQSMVHIFILHLKEASWQKAGWSL